MVRVNTLEQGPKENWNQKVIGYWQDCQSLEVLSGPSKGIYNKNRISSFGLLKDGTVAFLIDRRGSVALGYSPELIDIE